MHFLIPDFIISLLLLYPVYIIFQRAGLNSQLAYLVLIPVVGVLVVTVMLANNDWSIAKRSGSGE